MPSLRLAKAFYSRSGLTIIFVSIAVLAAISLPLFLRARTHFVDKYLEQAKKAEAANNPSLVIGTLEQANALSFGDSRPLFELAAYYRSFNRPELAVVLYKRIPFNKAYQELGTTAIQMQDYTLASQTYDRAVKKEPTAENYGNLAVAQFNLGLTERGCSSADKALKSDLKNELAIATKQVCDVLTVGDKARLAELHHELPKEFYETDRGVAYFLIKHRIMRVAEQKLINANEKASTDWLLLARIAGERRDYNTGIKNALEGIKLDKTNVELNKTLAQYYAAIGNQDDSKRYQDLVKDLFSK